MSDNLPKKLKNDSILEALVELRFIHSEVPEIAFARLADLERWSGFNKTRLPLAEVPLEIRTRDNNLLYQALVQLVSKDRSILAKVGTNVASIHNVNRYSGWDNGFSQQVKSLVEDLFSKIPGAQVNRIGVRYINAFEEQQHGISSPYDLALEINAGGRVSPDPFNLTFFDTSRKGFNVISRLSSPSLVGGNMPSGATAILDIDVITAPSFLEDSPDRVFSWIEEAHRLEKEAFFGLLKQETIEALREE